MARCRLGVNYPEPLATIRPVEYTANGTKYYFIHATGCSRSFEDLVASVQSLDGQTIAKGDSLVEGMHWVFGFEGLPNTPNQDYFLFVAQTCQDDGGHVGQVIPFRVGQPGGSYSGNIPIQYPGQDDTICPNFTASGSLYQGNATNGAFMRLNNANVTVGAQVLGTPPGVWMYQFLNVPQNSGYTFRVTDVGNNNGENTGITVDVTACGSEQPPGGGGGGGA